MIKALIVPVLLGNTDITAMVVDRIWLGVRTQGERRPGIVVTTLSGHDEGTLTGPSGSTEGSIRLDCLAPTAAAAEQLADAVITAIDGKSFSGIDFLFVTDREDIPIEIPQGAGTSATFGEQLTIEYMLTN